MTGLTWLTVAALILASYLSALHLALMGVSHSALLERFAKRDRQAAAQWILDRRRATLLCSSLLQTAFRVGFYMLVLVDVVGMGPETRLTLSNLLLSSALAILLLWLFSFALASAIARYAGTGLLAGSAWLLRVIAWTGMPLARALRFMDEIVRRLTGANLHGEDHVEAELMRNIADAEMEGHIDPVAADLLENVVEFRSTDVGEVMTPRTDIRGIEYTDDLAVIRRAIAEAGYSRFPVYEENLDHIVGILYVKDLIPYLGEQAPRFRLKPLLRQPIRVPETRSVAELLADFQRSEVHMAIVIDEYGGTAGLATIEDVLEELVGEIQDEHDDEADELPTMVTTEQGRVVVDGRFRVAEVNERLSMELPEDQEFDTIGGFVLAHLGRVPDAGETFEAHGARFRVVDAAPSHVRKVGIELLAPARVNGDESSK
jgi:CBS domain containing-hemolysin-like protein